MLETTCFKHIIRGELETSYVDTVCVSKYVLDESSLDDEERRKNGLP